MAGHGQKSSSLSSAEVGRLWEEPTEEIGPTSDSVGILAVCGGEDVKKVKGFLTSRKDNDQDGSGGKKASGNVRSCSRGLIPADCC